MNDKISNKDKKDWNDFINSSEKIPNKDLKYHEKKILKVRTIDLHGFKLDEANKIVESFINKAYLEQVNKLVIVTGKGIHSSVEKDPYVSRDLSILKYSVPEFIYNNQNLMKIINDIQDATIQDGGSGAFYVFLKNNNK